MPEELPAAYDRLLADRQFCQILDYLYPGTPADAIRQKMHSCKTSLEFQTAFCYDFLKNLMEKASKSLDMDVSALDVSGRYTFVSNHRDIVLDSALLDKLLIDTGFKTTCEIAIGDNLLTLPWVRDLVRINKSFIVQRSLPPREMLMASRLMSEYMHCVISEKHDNIWIAQREGRAKDSNDRTQSAILKMMAMGGGTGTPAERLRRLHIVPLAISYEYDPCDYLKAREMQLRRDNAGWRKGPTDDIISMQTGVMGYKGRVHYHCAPCIDGYLDSLPAGIPKTEVFDVVAAHIDREIFRNYRLYPCNYIAVDMLRSTEQYAGRYTGEERAAFGQYIESRMAKITDVPRRDDAFLRRSLLLMYANPAINKMSAE